MTAAHIRNHLAVHDRDDIMVATSKYLIIDGECEFCDTAHPAIGYLCWRLETEPTEPEPTRIDDMRVCLCALLPALDTIEKTPDFMSAFVEVPE